MLGVFINVLAVVVGSLVGLLLKRGIPQRVSQAMNVALGVCILYVGISGSLVGQNALVVITAVVLGVLVGTLTNIDGALNRLGTWVEGRLCPGGAKTGLAQGMVSGTLLFCVGAMAVTGSLQAGLTGDNSVLITKAVLDLVSAALLASTLGAGVALSAVAVLILQGSLVLASGWLSPLLSSGAVNEMTCAGSLIILLIGTNMMGITRVKVADYLPAILLAPLLYQLVPLWESVQKMLG